MEYTKEMLIDFRKNVLGLEITKVDEPIPPIDVRRQNLYFIYTIFKNVQKVSTT